MIREPNTTSSGIAAVRGSRVTTRLSPAPIPSAAPSASPATQPYAAHGSMTRCRILSALSTSREPPSGAAVFELHRVVVPSCSGAAAVPRTQAPRHRPPRTSRSHRPLDARQSSGRLSRGSGIIGISGTSLRDWKCRRHGAKIVPFRQQIPHGSSSWWPDTPIYLHPPKAQDAALSRLKHGFESRRERQSNQ